MATWLFPRSAHHHHHSQSTPGDPARRDQRSGPAHDVEKIDGHAARPDLAWVKRGMGHTKTFTMKATQGCEWNVRQATLWRCPWKILEGFRVQCWSIDMQIMQIGWHIYCSQAADPRAAPSCEASFTLTFPAPIPSANLRSMLATNNIPPNQALNHYNHVLCYHQVAGIQLVEVARPKQLKIEHLQNAEGKAFNHAVAHACMQARQQTPAWHFFNRSSPGQSQHATGPMWKRLVCRHPAKHVESDSLGINCY